MKELRFGVIGSGGRGSLAKFAHDPEKGSTITACCDINPETLAKNKEDYGSDLFTTDSVEKLLERDLDGVFICSPDFLHEEQTVAALEAGKAVYLEKPMAITIDGCDQILEASKKTGTKLFVGHNMRYMTIIRKMKELIDKGTIGEVKSIWCRHFISYGGDAYFRDWHSESKYSTGMLLQKGAHDIDVMHWLAGSYSRRVSAFGNLSVYDKCERRKPEEKGNPEFNATHWPPRKQSGFSPKIDIEDQTVMHMEMGGDILGAYLQCHFSPDCCRNYTVIGTEGRLENMGDTPTSPIFIWNRRTDRYELIGDEVYRGDPVDEGSHGGADPVIVQEFIDYVRGDITETTATPEAARMSIAAGYLATMSLRDGGKPRDVPELP